MMSWAAEEFQVIDSGIQGLDERVMLLAERLAANPLASVPPKCFGGWKPRRSAVFLPKTTSNRKISS